MEINNKQLNEAKCFAWSVKNTMDRHGYGLGEVGYYFKEWKKEMIEDGASEETARAMAKKAEEILERIVEVAI